MQTLPIASFKELIEKGYTIVDTRKPEIFCDGFIEESLSIPFNESFIDMLDELTEPGQKIILVSDEADITAIAKAIKDAVVENVEGVLQGGFEAWQTEGNETDLLIAIDADEFAMDYKYDEFYLVDVRSKEEFANEHAEDAENIVLNDLEQILIEFETGDSYYVYGNTAAEAVTAASVFKRTGFNRVRAVVADYETIKNTAIPFFVQKKDDKQSKFSNN